MAKDEIPKSIWQGKIINILSKKSFSSSELDVTLHIYKVDTTLQQLICHLTFGAYGIVLDPHLPTSNSPIGEPHIIENMGFFPADLNNKRFFNYLEIHGYVDKVAWDKRNIALRARSDLRRDFAKKLSQPNGDNGGLMSFGSTDHWVENYSNRLALLKQAIDEFRNVLLFRGEETEDVFHDILETYPILLDVYGKCESKPRFKYPNEEKSPVGKNNVEPDFIVSYPDQSYKLVELERASKDIATIQGQPRSEVSQAVFQTAEWIHFIREHYSQIKQRYPGIHTKYKTSLIMSRSTQESFRNVRDMNRYKELILQQYSIDEVLTYDDLFERACTAYSTLTGLSPQNLKEI